MAESIFDETSPLPAFYEALAGGSVPRAVITADDKEGAALAHAARFLDYPAYVLPDFRADWGDDLRSYRDELEELLGILNAYHRDPKQKKILFVPLSTAAKYLPAPELFKRESVGFGETVEIEPLKSLLHNWGYTFVDVVEQKGEASFRGDILDIFSPDAETAIRISLFDDQVESIRRFDVNSQKSEEEELDEAPFVPAIFGLDEAEYKKLDSIAARSDSDAFYKDVASLGFWHLASLGKGIDVAASLEAVATADFSDRIDDLYAFNKEGFVPKESLTALPLLPKARKFKTLQVKEPATLIAFHKEKKVRLIASNEAVLKQYDIEPDERVRPVYGPHILNLVGPDELIISLNKPQKKKRKVRPRIVLDELGVGEYVVHENYGIGVFEGLTQVSILGGVRDFVTIRYAGDDKLLLPVENLHLIDRYVADSGTVPVIDKLGKGSFAKLKEGVRKQIVEIANEIVRRAAQRELVEGTKIPVPDELESFRDDAGFIYTNDQDRSITEILADMGTGRVMDRLLSGDVGFGKTEVAMNAIFAVVKAGCQATLVAPTTLLSNQHYHSLEERLSPYGIKVAKMDRFTTPKEKKAYKTGMENGDLHVMVGTHAILGVEFKNLGLIIVDEEHKFGVKQKEKLKDKAKNVHLLSMSATPIPRSLNMAMSKIKGFSQILTPPEEREDVRTFVKEYDEKLMKEVVMRELRRGGQVFYVHNRIAGLKQKQKQLNDILPNLKILVLHSQVGAEESEQELINFTNKQYDLLLSTTIIESGIHMPNVNTIIIDGADKFGIADLHQLRGRVGRGKRQGFCYYMVDDKDAITEDAKKRLIALENNSFLGSGAALAFHDLEIRGGGNILGVEQSGKIKNLGYGLYLKMLEDSINQLSGTQQVEEKEVEIKLAVKAYISEETAAQDRVRLELYRRLAQCKTPTEVYEIEEEMIDRFGKLDDPTKQFIQIMVIKILAAGQNVKNVSNFQQNISILYHDEKKEVLKAPSKDDDDLIATVMEFLRKNGK